MQDKIGEREFNVWSLYIKKYGPLNPVRMYDRPAGIISSIISRVNGGKAEAKDFMPYGRKDEDKVIDGQSFVDRLSQHKGVKIGR